MKIFMFIITVLALSLFIGCQSNQERKGYSAKPFNRPASWETNPIIGN